MRVINYKLFPFCWGESHLKSWWKTEKRLHDRFKQEKLLTDIKKIHSQVGMHFWPFHNFPYNKHIKKWLPMPNMDLYSLWSVSAFALKLYSLTSGVVPVHKKKYSHSNLTLYTIVFRQIIDCEICFALLHSNIIQIWRKKLNFFGKLTYRFYRKFTKKSSITIV